MLTVLVPLVVLALLAFVAVPFARGREGLDLSAQTLFRAYLYVASLAGVAVAVFGVASLLQAAMALAFGNDFVYGTVPPGPGFVQPPLSDPRRAEDTVRGISFATFGFMFWLLHWIARNRTGQGDQGALARGYFLVGTAVFGVATIILAPMGVYQGLTFWLVPRPPGTFRPGVQDSLAGGVSALAAWLLYLRIVMSQLPRGGAWTFGRGPASPPGAASIGARVGPGPSSRSAGAEAVPPREDR